MSFRNPLNFNTKIAMVQLFSILILAALALLQENVVVEAFTIHNPSSSTSSLLYPLPHTIHTLSQGSKINEVKIHSLSLYMSTNNNSNEDSGSASSFPSRRRRKRKDGKNINPMTNEKKENDTDNEEIVETVETVEDVVEVINNEKPSTASKPVQLQIRDVRDIVSGVTPSTQDDDKDDDEYEYYDDEEEEEDDDDDEYEYYYEDENDNEVIVASGSKDSSLEALLADAKRMRQEEAKNSDSSEDGFSIPSAIRGVISTIVTIDFFVVCALLAWFLAGIFFSYVVKDDTVQIAFNGIFEPVVQPALGILMIGSAAGAVFKEQKEIEI